MAFEWPCGKRVSQASSMVKGISGPSQAVSRSNTASITVRAARGGGPRRQVAVEAVAADVEEQRRQLVLAEVEDRPDHVLETVAS
jgi:hypothetical protein